MPTTMIDIADIEPLTHNQAMRLQSIELERTITWLRSLDDRDWTRQTACPGWDLRAMYQHVLGACEAGASIHENVHQIRRARTYRKHRGGPLEAALSAVQVEERAELTQAQIIERLTAIAPKTVRGRSRTPAIVRNHFRLAVDGPVHETWKLGYLIDVIYLRDLWMHRIDAVDAVGQTFEPDQQHDGRIIAGVVAEWAHRHQMPFVLELTGPAGAAYAHNPSADNAQHLTDDAVNFCRTLAGRHPADGLFATVVPF